MAAPAEKKEKEPFQLKLQKFLNNQFGKVGTAVANAPLRTMVSAIIVAFAIATPFFIDTNEENRGDKLWVPDDSRAQDDRDYVSDLYGFEPRIQEIILSSKDGSDVLTPEALAVTLEIYNISVGVVSRQGETFEELCEIRGGFCVTPNILELFDYNSNNFMTTDQILDAVNQPDPRTRGGDILVIDEILGGIQRNESGYVVKASALSLVFELDNRQEVSSGSYEDRPAERWEDEWLDVIGSDEVDDIADTENLEVDRSAERSLNDEFGDAIEGDVITLQIAIIVLIIFTLFVMYRVKKGLRSVRYTLAVGTVVSVGLAIVSALGFARIVQIHFTPLVTLGPFLLLGIGVDDTFVMLAAYERTDATMPVPERIENMLRVAGTSIFVTSFTDFLAFLVGSNTSLPALRWFSLTVAFGVMFDFLYQITFFAAIMTFEARREQEGRYDFLCCCCRSSKDNQSGAQKPTKIQSSESTRMEMKEAPKHETISKKEPDSVALSITGSNEQASEAEYKHHGGFLDYLVEAYLKIIVKPWFKIVTIVVFLGIWGVAISGAAQLRIEGDEQNFIPSGSYLLDYYDVKEDLFRVVGEEVAVYFGEIDYTDQNVWAAIQEEESTFRDSKWVVEDSVQSWLQALQDEYTDLDSSNFYSLLEEFLNTTGTVYTADVVYNDDKSLLVSSRLTGNHIFRESSSNQVKSMKSLRGDVRDVADDFPILKEDLDGDRDEEVRAYAPEYITYEQYARIKEEFFRNVGSATGTILVVIMLLVPNFRVSVTVFLTVALTIFNIVGYMHYWGVILDSVAVINLVVSLGLSVDYSAHIGLAYSVSSVPAGLTGATQIRNHKAKKALIEVGAAVISGALSTFIAVALVAGSKSYVFITFFKILTLATLLGLAHGAILLPVLLSIVGNL